MTDRFTAAKWLVLILILLATHGAFADVQVSLYPLLSESRFERTQEQELSSRTGSIIAGGVDIDAWSILFERSVTRDRYTSGSWRSELEKSHYLLNGRLNIWNTRWGQWGRLELLPSLGVGVHRVETRTTIDQESGTESSDWERMISAGVGLRFRASYFSSELEARALNGSLLDPATIMSVVLRLGVMF